MPDIYDCIKYDHLHNKSIFQCTEAEELYTYAKNMADVVIPQVLIIKKAMQDIQKYIKYQTNNIRALKLTIYISV